VDEPREFAFNVAPSAVDPGTDDHERIGNRRGQPGEPSADVPQEAFQTTQIDQRLPFRTSRQIRVDTLLVARRDRVDEQPRVGDQPLPERCLRGLVMFEPALELSGRQRTGLQGGEQLLGVIGVGARQRGDDAAGGPGGDAT